MMTMSVRTRMRMLMTPVVAATRTTSPIGTRVCPSRSRSAVTLLRRSFRYSAALTTKQQQTIQETKIIPSIVFGTNNSSSTNNSKNNNNNMNKAIARPAFSSLSPGITEEDRELVLSRVKSPQTSVSLQALMSTGRGEFLLKTFDAGQVEQHTATDLVLRQVASFLQRELPIRFAHRVRDLENVPYLSDMDAVRGVRDLYIQSGVDIIRFSDDHALETIAEEEAFARLVESIYERHSNVLVQMARGAFEFRKTLMADGKNDKDTFVLQNQIHAFLDRFYMSRIGIRVLIGQYLALRQPPVENYIGIICSKTSPYEIVKRAIDDAAFMCTRKYGDAPEVIMTGRLDLTFPYVPTHLHYIMLELLKNSMRATVEHHGIDGDFPPIKVVIADGAENEDVVIKVSDEGGGITRSNMSKIWSYLFTTADPQIQENMVGAGPNVDHGIDSPLAGLGYGLPISRSYCRYFGGDLSIMSMEGYGTDAFVYLTRLGNTREPLPM